MKKTMQVPAYKIAIIGGTGHETIENPVPVNSIAISSSYGLPNSEIFTGKIKGVPVLFMHRQGRNREVPVTDINYRANFAALERLGCRYIFATSTCASLQQEVCPGDIVIPDQYIDLTKSPRTNISRKGAANKEYRRTCRPFSEELSDHLIEAAIVNGITVHNKGTVITIEGPHLPTKAESLLYQQWGGDVVDMTTAPEVILANMLDIQYARLALCTEYDSWNLSDKEAEGLVDQQVIKGKYDSINLMLTYAVTKLNGQE